MVLWIGGSGGSRASGLDACQQASERLRFVQARQVDGDDGTEQTRDVALYEAKRIY